MRKHFARRTGFLLRVKFQKISRMSACWILFLLMQSMQSATLLTGDNGTTSTFSFAIGPVIATSDVSGISHFTTGAATAVSGNIFSVAQYSSIAAQFIPIGISRVTLNGVKDQANPLTGKKIKFLASHVSAPPVQINVPFVVVDEGGVLQTEKIYSFPEVTLVDKTKPTQTAVKLVSSAVPADASGATAGSIVALTSAALSATGSPDVAFGAVTENGSSTFGSGNSGVCMAQFTRTGSVVQGYGYTLCMLNANTGAVGNKAVALNRSSTVIKVGSSDPTIVAGSPLDFYWDSTLQCLYIALQVTAAAGASNGARALVVGRVNETGALHFEKIVADGAITSNDRLIGAANGGTASIHKVRTMHTSTGLSYLIVNGGNGVMGDVANYVCAIPLIDNRNSSNWRTDAAHGTAANVAVAPVTTYNVTGDNRFLWRSFTSAATTASQLYTLANAAALVGAGALPIITSSGSPRLIGDIQVAGDAVYVSVPYDYAAPGQQPGVFQSRAIFDNYGRIVAWTPWTRVSGNAELAHAAFIDRTNGNFWFVSENGSGVVNNVKKTVWGLDAKDGLLGGTTSDSSVGLINIFAQFFPASKGGIQAFSALDSQLNTQSMPHSGINNTTILLAAGNGLFALAKTGDTNGVIGTIKPYVGDFADHIAHGTNGTFPSGSGRVFTVSGGMLERIGPPTAVTVFGNSSRSWIAVGGVNGVAVLSDANGQGFAPTSMPTGFTFKLIGNYKYVKKLVGAGDYLYVLTQSGLDRVSINPATFVSGVVQHTVVAATQQLNLGTYGSFSDVLIGNNFALLATNNGLFRIANGCSISHSPTLWVPYVLNESPGPIYSLSFAGSTSDTLTSFASGAQVFALVAYHGYEQACFYRLYIKEEASVTDTSVQMIGDLYKKGLLTYFASFGQLRGGYTDDGALRFAVRAVDTHRTLALYVLPPYLRVALTHFPTNNSTAVSTGVTSNCIMSAPLRSDASGAWLVYGNFGMHVNE